MNVKRLGNMWQVGWAGVTLALGVAGCEGASTNESSGATEATVPAAGDSDDATVDRDPGTPGGWNYVDAVDMGPVLRDPLNVSDRSAASPIAPGDRR